MHNSKLCVVYGIDYGGIIMQNKLNNKIGSIYKIEEPKIEKNEGINLTKLMKNYFKLVCYKNENELINKHFYTFILFNSMRVKNM